MEFLEIALRDMEEKLQEWGIMKTNETFQKDSNAARGHTR